MWFLFALGSAASFGLRGILYQWTSKRPMDRNLMLLGVFVSGMIISLLGCVIFDQPWNAAVWVGALMGFISFISNVALYKGYAVGKASLIAMFCGLPPVVVVILAYLAWGEKLNTWQLTAFIVIMAGLLMIRYSNDLSLKNLQGAQWGALVMLLFGLTDFLTKEAAVLEAPMLPTIAAMYATGSLGLALMWFRSLWKMKKTAKSQADAAIRETAAAVESTEASSTPSVIAENPLLWSNWRTLLWGMVVGITNVAGMMFAMPAFKLGAAGLVSVIIAANVVLIMLYAGFVLKEKFTRTELGGLFIALAGIVILKLTS